MKSGNIILLALWTGFVLAGGPVLTLDPRVLRGVPGEPLQIELTIETADTLPVRLLVPSISNLTVRTVERIPIRRTAEGRFVQKRIVIWQGLEAGTTTLTNLLAETSAGRFAFPPVQITVDPVEPAKPPVKESAE